MSTAGKVLAGLFILVVPVWMILAAGVATLNVEGLKAVEKLKTDVANLEKEVKETEARTYVLRDQIAQVQDEGFFQEAVHRTHLADLERARGISIEALARLQNQKELIAGSIQTANIAREQRKTERDKEQSAKQAFEAEVAQLRAQNSQLMDQLSQLRDDFKKTLEANKQLVDRAAQRPQALRRSPVSYLPEVR